MIRTIRWQHRHNGYGDPDPIVWVDVLKVDADWKLDPDRYVRRGGFLQSNSPYRWKRALQRFSTGQPYFMPWILFQDGQLSIEDGRHGFSCARDHGATAVPMQALSDPAQIISRYGTAERVSAVRLSGLKPFVWWCGHASGLRIMR